MYFYKHFIFQEKKTFSVKSQCFSISANFFPVLIEVS
jgi:hypothetical protein